MSDKLGITWIKDELWWLSEVKTWRIITPIRFHRIRMRIKQLENRLRELQEPQVLMVKDD